MAKSPEELLKELDDQGKILKEDYKASLRTLIESKPSVSIEKLETLIQSTHSKATIYYNHYDNAVGQADLLDTFRSSIWAKNFFETGYNVLESVVEYYGLLKSICDKRNLDYSLYRPSEFAFSSLQAIVYNFLKTEKSKLDRLKSDFENLNLPIHGFKKMKIKMISNTEKYLAFGFGLAFFILIYITSILIPTPSSFQYLVFRIMLALAAGGIGGILPGFIQIQGKWEKFLIRAGGALALFVIVYFLNPGSQIK